MILLQLATRCRGHDRASGPVGGREPQRSHPGSRCLSGENQCRAAAGSATALSSPCLSAPSTTRGLQVAGARPHPRVRGAEYRSPASESLRHPFQWPRRGLLPWRGHLFSARL